MSARPRSAAADRSHGGAAATDWRDVFEVQMDLHRFWTSPLGELVASRFARSVESRSRETRPSSYRQLAHYEAETLWRASPIYVSDEMMDLVEHAAETFAPEPLLETDLLCSYGFVMFPRPIVGIDAQGYTTTWRAAAWMPVKLASELGSAPLPGSEIVHVHPGDESGIWLSLYTKAEDIDKVEADANLHVARARERYEDVWPHLYVLLHSTPWYFGMSVESFLGEVELLDNQKSEFAYEATAGNWRFLQAFFRLAMGYVSTRTQIEIPRASRRRGERLKMRPGYTTVITLRRPKTKKDEEPGTVEWSHRWIRSGHWRNQWYPSLNAHRQIWINETICGPEDKPLVLRKGRAFRLVR